MQAKRDLIDAGYAALSFFVLLMRQVPQDLTAEQSLLGAMLVDPNCIPEVIEQVRADDFYAEENKRIFETIYSMFNGAQRIDPVTVLDMLTRMGYYDEAGGRAYLFQLDSAERPRSPRRSLRHCRAGGAAHLQHPAGT